DAAPIRYAACRRGDRRDGGWHPHGGSPISFSRFPWWHSSPPYSRSELSVCRRSHIPPHWRQAPERSDDDWTKALKVNPYTSQQGARAQDVPDMQWRRPVPEFGTFGNQNFGGAQRRGW